MGAEEDIPSKITAVFPWAEHRGQGIEKIMAGVQDEIP